MPRWVCTHQECKDKKKTFGFSTFMEHLGYHNMKDNNGNTEAFAFYCAEPGCDARFVTRLHAEEHTRSKPHEIRAIAEVIHGTSEGGVAFAKLLKTTGAIEGHDEHRREQNHQEKTNPTGTARDQIVTEWRPPTPDALPGDHNHHQMTPYSPRTPRTPGPDSTPGTSGREQYLFEQYTLFTHFTEWLRTNQVANDGRPMTPYSPRTPIGTPGHSAPGTPVRISPPGTPGNDDGGIGYNNPLSSDVYQHNRTRRGILTPELGNVGYPNWNTRDRPSRQSPARAPHNRPDPVPRTPENVPNTPLHPTNYASHVATNSGSKLLPVPRVGHESHNDRRDYDDDEHDPSKPYRPRSPGFLPIADPLTPKRYTGPSHFHSPSDGVDQHTDEERREPLSDQHDQSRPDAHRTHGTRGPKTPHGTPQRGDEEHDDTSGSTAESNGGVKATPGTPGLAPDLGKLTESTSGPIVDPNTGPKYSRDGHGEDRKRKVYGDDEHDPSKPYRPRSPGILPVPLSPKRYTRPSRFHRPSDGLDQQIRKDPYNDEQRQSRSAAPRIRGTRGPKTPPASELRKLTENTSRPIVDPNTDPKRSRDGHDEDRDRRVYGDDEHDPSKPYRPRSPGILPVPLSPKRYTRPSRFHRPSDGFDQHTDRKRREPYNDEERQSRSTAPRIRVTRGPKTPPGTSQPVDEQPSRKRHHADTTTDLYTGPSRFELPSDGRDQERTRRDSDAGGHHQTRYHTAELPGTPGLVPAIGASENAPDLGKLTKSSSGPVVDPNTGPKYSRDGHGEDTKRKVYGDDEHDPSKPYRPRSPGILPVPLSPKRYTRPSRFHRLSDGFDQQKRKDSYNDEQRQSRSAAPRIRGTRGPKTPSGTPPPESPPSRPEHDLLPNAYTGPPRFHASDEHRDQHSDNAQKDPHDDHHQSRPGPPKIPGLPCPKQTPVVPGHAPELPCTGPSRLQLSKKDLTDQHTDRSRTDSLNDDHHPSRPRSPEPARSPSPVTIFGAQKRVRLIPLHDAPNTTSDPRLSRPSNNDGHDQRTERKEPRDDKHDETSGVTAECNAGTKITPGLAPDHPVLQPPKTRTSTGIHAGPKSTSLTRDGQDPRNDGHDQPRPDAHKTRGTRGPKTPPGTPPPESPPNCLDHHFPPDAYTGPLRFRIPDEHHDQHSERAQKDPHADDHHQTRPLEPARSPSPVVISGIQKRVRLIPLHAAANTTSDPRLARPSNNNGHDPRTERKEPRNDKHDETSGATAESNAGTKVTPGTPRRDFLPRKRIQSDSHTTTTSSTSPAPKRPRYNTDCQQTSALLPSTSSFVLGEINLIEPLHVVWETKKKRLEDICGRLMEKRMAEEAAKPLSVKQEISTSGPEASDLLPATRPSQVSEKKKPEKRKHSVSHHRQGVTKGQERVRREKRTRKVSAHIVLGEKEGGPEETSTPFLPDDVKSNETSSSIRNSRQRSSKKVVNMLGETPRQDAWRP